MSFFATFLGVVCDHLAGGKVNDPSLRSKKGWEEGSDGVLDTVPDITDLPVLGKSPPQRQVQVIVDPELQVSVKTLNHLCDPVIPGVIIKHLSADGVTQGVQGYPGQSRHTSPRWHLDD